MSAGGDDQGLHQRHRRWWLIAGAVAVVAVVASTGLVVASGGAARSAGGTARTAPSDGVSAEPSVTASSQLPAGYAVLPDDGAFSPGTEVSASVEAERADPFLARFGTSSDARVLVVTAPQQPAAPVQVTLPYDPTAVPEGGQASVFYYDDELNLWIPVPTTADEASGRLTATTDHFTTFAAALLAQRETIDTVARWTDWLAFQVADLVGARADTPECGVRPAWVTDLVDRGLDTAQTPMARNRPLLACAGGSDSSPTAARLSVASNRAYGFSVSSSEAAGQQSFAATPDLVDASLVVLATTFQAETGRTYLPAGEQLDLDFAQPTSRTTVRVTAETDSVSLALDLVATTLRLLADQLPGDVARRADVYQCLVDTLQVLPVDGVSETTAGGWADASTTCLSAALAPGPTTSAGRLLKAAAVGLLAGQLGQSTLDRSRDLVDGAALDLVLDPATTRPATRDAKVGDVLGRWTGPVDQPGVRPYSIDVLITQHLDGAAAQVTYPGLGCSGTWRYVGAASGAVLFEESIDDDPDRRCIATVPIALRMTEGGQLVVEFERPSAFAAVVERRDA